MEAICSTSGAGRGRGGRRPVAARRSPRSRAMAPGAALRRRRSTSCSRTALDGVVIATPSALHAEQALRRARARRGGVLPEAAGAHRRRDARASSTPRAAPTACSASTSRTATPRPCSGSASCVAGGELGERLCGRPGLPQRLRPRQALVPRPGAVGRRLRRSTSASTWSTWRCGCSTSRAVDAVSSRLYAQGGCSSPNRERGRGLRGRPARPRRRRRGAARLLVEPRRPGATR